MCIKFALLFIAIFFFLIMAPNCDVKRTSLIKSAAACVCVCVCVGVGSHQSSIVYRGFNKLLIRADVQYGCSLLEWDDRSRQMCLFSPSRTLLFLPIAAIGTGSVDWEQSRFMCRLHTHTHTHGCYCSCVCATCAEYFSSLRLFTAPRSPRLSVSICGLKVPCTVNSVR